MLLVQDDIGESLGLNLQHLLNLIIHELVARVVFVVEGPSWWRDFRHRNWKDASFKAVNVIFHHLIKLATLHHHSFSLHDLIELEGILIGSVGQSKVVIFEFLIRLFLDLRDFIVDPRPTIRILVEVTVPVGDVLFSKDGVRRARLLLPASCVLSYEILKFGAMSYFIRRGQIYRKLSFPEPLLKAFEPLGNYSGIE